MRTLLTITAFCLAAVMFFAGAASAQDPDVRIVLPSILGVNYDSARGVSPWLEMSVVYTSGPDGAAPARYRYLKVRAQIPDTEVWVSSRYTYD